MIDSKIIFIDTEFTGEHIKTSLVSLGIVNIEGDQLYLTFNEYERDQVTDWLRENVLSTIDAGRSIGYKEGCEVLTKWLENYTKGKLLYVVSAGLAHDYLLFLELFKYRYDRKYFHALYDLPDYLNHHAAIDLNTMFRIAGLDPSIDRRSFAGYSKNENIRHNALDDAMVVRKCFLRLMKMPSFQQLLKS